ncbi:TRAP transporter small permease [Mesorhizobium australicum]|uniref:TRAP transporter small permease protein n=1 Tax=Mesorhizobium australicum TaxID=536018 RepID=A0A1X7N0T3_9HYPH|nr:TRAP transporter small permease [Mesorhizobium australicum]SMH30885.1 TRAP-type C4-dicarboxylate transport system, small permease component [Mesorhizobium australicum]
MEDVVPGENTPEPPRPAAFPVRILGRLIDVTTVVGAVAVALMMTHIAIDVLAKYVFGMPLPGTITVVSNYYMIVVAFLPLAFTERVNGHISVEVLTEHFPMGLQRALNIAAMLMAAFIIGALAWQSWLDAERARDIGTFEIEHDAKLLTWPARYLLPIGCALMALTFVAKILLALRRGAAQPLNRPFF